MISFLHKLIIGRVRTYYKKHPEKKKPNFSLTKRIKEVEVELIHEVKEMIYLIAGVLVATFGIKGFLLPNDFIDGGVMGISLIVYELFHWRLSLLVVIINLPFIVLAYHVISARFAFKSALGVLLFAISIYSLPIPAITDDSLLVASFGGVFLGLGIGLAIRGGAILDGTEVLAIYVSRKTSLTVGNVILLFNLFVFLAGAYFLSVEIAMYALLTYFAASQTVDFVIDGIEEYMSVTIITDYDVEIRNAIVNSLGRGCTIFKGERGLSVEGKESGDLNILYTIITRLEMSKLKTEVDKIDPKAFMVMASVKDTKGGMIKKKAISKIK